MHCHVDTTFIDSRAQDLRWSLNHPSIPALAETAVDLGRHQVRLQVLGASHQVVVESAGHQLIETVAYLPQVRQLLPNPGARDDLAHAPVGSAYDIRTTVEHLDPTALAARAAQVRATYGALHDGIVAEFPGLPDALTALGVERHDRGIRWKTWHVYPQHGQAVQTSTTITTEETT